MIIIGKTGGGYILEASQEELAHLAGYYFKGDHTRPAYEGSPLRVGDKIEIHKMYDQLHEQAQLQDKIAEAKGLLRAAARSLDLVDPVVLGVKCATKGENLDLPKGGDHGGNA